LEIKIIYKNYGKMAKLLGNYGEIILEKLFHNIFKNKVVFVTGLLINVTKI